MNNLIYRCPITLQLTVTIPLIPKYNCAIHFCTVPLIRYRNSNCQFKARKSTRFCEVRKIIFSL